MKIQIEQFSSVTVIRPEGQIVHPRGDLTLRAAIREQLEAGRRRFVLALGSVPFIDSAGVGELVASLKSVRSEGGEIKFCSLSQRVSDVILMLGLTQILEIYADEQDAIASFV